MCGIAGIIDATGAPVARSWLEAMTRTLAPRGPDSEGFWFGTGAGLGHRRLAVIDLSPAGNQPMANEDGTVLVVSNGEIYDHGELRRELVGHGHVFHSRTDTEVIVHGYEQWGDAVVDHLDGMFAFAIWDSRQRHLFAARDRMGKKPFYFAEISRAGQAPLFAFASELKALLPLPGFDRGVSPEALARYLTFEYVPAPFSICAGARKLGAAERLTLDVREGRPITQIRRYWELPFPERHVPRHEQDAAEELRDLLGKAVKRRLVADVPLGIFLSGGLDSSTVAALATDHAAGRILTFSVGFADPSFDESTHAAAVAHHIGSEHHTQRIDSATLMRALPEVMGFLDEPLADASILPTYLLSRFARGHVTVALGGDGGDELFAGYQTFFAEPWGHLFFDVLPRSGQSLARRLAAMLPASTGYFSLDFKMNQFLRGGDVPGPRRHQRWMASFLPEELPGLLMPEIRRTMGPDPLAILDAMAVPGRVGPDALMDFYARFYLAQDVNTKVDRAAGSVGLEVRAPFLDTAVVSFACRLPPDLRMRHLTSKYILKRAMRARLPAAIVGRRKQGFGVPVARWMREEMAPTVRESLNPSKLRREGFFDPTVVAGLVDDHLLGRRDRRKALWTLLLFEHWLAAWGR
jgi:asparagine synthase (glutamine-hydrolysing)